MYRMLVEIGVIIQVKQADTKTTSMMMKGLLINEIVARMTDPMNNPMIAVFFSPTTFVIGPMSPPTIRRGEICSHKEPVERLKNQSFCDDWSKCHKECVI